MKRVYKNLIFLSLSGLLCLFLAVPTYAQHGGGHGGGGGGHSGGGGHFGGGGGGGHVSSGGGGHYGMSSGARVSGGTHFNGGARNFSNRGRATYSGRAYAGGNRAYAGRPAGRGGVTAYRGGGYRGGNYGRGGAYRGGYGRGYRGYGYRGRFGYGGWYNHGGFFGSLYGPRIGFSVGFLPYGYYPFYWGDYQYYYSNGFYYQYDNNQYTVVDPPIGAEINTLPSNAQSIVINGQQYYEINGVYYVAITKDDGSLAYQIAGKDGELNTDGDQQQGDQGNYAPQTGSSDQGSSAIPYAGSNRANVQIGDIVPNLPTDARGVTVNGTRMFVTPDDIYYQETRDNNNHKAYKVVGLPSEAPE
jgi:hypothetical protein